MRTGPMMRLATLVYRRMLTTRVPRRRAWALLRAAMIRMGDPLCRMPVRGRKMLMPLSHRLPQNLRDCPLYDAWWGRLGIDLRERAGGLHLWIVDVGANIGQTCIGLGLERRDCGYAFEPHPRFLACAAENLRHLPGIMVMGTAMTDQVAAPPAGCLVARGGTAAFRAGEKEAAIAWGTIDEVTAGWPRLDLLKIDTDGMDAAILTGAERTIARLRPVVAWECGPFGQREERFVGDTLGTFARLERAGYRRFDVYANGGERIEYYPQSQTAEGTVIRAVTLAGAPYCDVVAWPNAASEARRGDTHGQ